MKHLSKYNASNGRHQQPAKQVATIELVTTTRVDVPVALYEKVRSSLTWNLPYLHGLNYLVPEDLVGPEFWCDLTDTEKRMAKACIAHMSQSKVLPIRPRDSEPECTNFYVLS
jgi:hypothetical protein